MIKEFNIITNFLNFYFNLMEKRNNFDHSIMTSSGVHKEYFLELSSHSEIIASCIIKKLISYTISEVMSKERINITK